MLDPRIPPGDEGAGCGPVVLVVVGQGEGEVEVVHLLYSTVVQCNAADV